MPKTKLTKVMQDYTRGVVSEDGINYRHESQEMDPVIERVNFLSQKVNTAPRAGNTHDMRYLGSIPLTVLTDWCNKVGIGVDAYARDQFGEKQKFISYLKQNFPVFLAAKKKPSQILTAR